MTGIVAGKLAFVSGAASGIGRATCQILAREGAIVIGADKNKKGAQETIENISKLHENNHFSLEISVSDKKSVQNVLQQIIQQYKKPPSIVINCAGITRDNFLLKLSEEDFNEVIDVNLKGTFLVVQTFAKALVDNGINSGSFVNMASIIGKIGNMGQTNYAASKAGVELFTKSAAKEFGKFGIRCNSVLPGFILTPMTETIPEKVKMKLLSTIASNRYGKPEEVAEVIAFLASDKSSYVNGASIEVTGGM
ncbi:short-chain dehydrogenases/reductases family member [Holotrichia oblita]|uniref:Short-chain dehydrogenases/reductases family member n=1 Tax=Holotrichia oblita TaxID=644536 RepID=A0ACB9SW50_HOLOL|nr:short-chain dehydrogenases/reductases family member [Holotrichia oblita]